ncbi:uncharacterized protein LOC110446201 [Mizuhopecten yessoensis]|uniref:Uncharacterized protein n=1 Tax=Mizuhopecten yessoensis TaxID=6573 RepID=A0A210R6Q8_MIZYE|nr:uncharacterized protein LOC110446201 [Mizuhopecten yessoensis]OWF56551.1 hypothetical protein KP79_PYT12027 [Mizuhopecten yessoensis]
MKMFAKCNSSRIRTTFKIITADIVFEAVLMLGLVHLVRGTGCPKGGPSTMEICKTRSLTASSILLDFYPARNIPVDECDCTVLIYQGNKVSFNPVSVPNYVGCGSEIHIQRYLPRGEKQVISCLGSTTFPGLSPGNTLTISLKRVHEPYDTSYCYRLDIEGKAASMSLVCEAAKTTTTIAITTSQAFTTTDQDQTGNQSSRVEVLDTESLPTLTGVGTIAMTTVMSVLIIYSTVITLLYILLRKKRQQQEKAYNEIYEEIPSKPPVQIRDSRSTRLSSISDDRALPAIPQPTFQRQYSQYNANAPPQRAPSISEQTHWNWTYQDKTPDKEQTYINQPF